MFSYYKLKFILLLSVALVLPFFVGSEEVMKNNAKSDEKEILALIDKKHEAMIARDTNYLRSISGDGVRHMTGRVQPIDEWLSDVASERMKYYSFRIVNYKIRFDGSFATIEFTDEIVARIYGTRGTWRLTSGGEFEKVGGKWQWKN